VLEQFDSGTPRVTGIAHEHGGTIDKFIGDAMLIVFGDPETKADRADAHTSYVAEATNWPWLSFEEQQSFFTELGIDLVVDPSAPYGDRHWTETVMREDPERVEAHRLTIRRRNLDVIYSLIYMLPLSAKIPFDWHDLTPVSVIALDQFVLWDNAAGPKSVKEFIEAAKAGGSPFKMGGTGSKREDHVLTVFMEKRTGAKFSYLPYKSGGEAATQLVGNHTESNVNNPSENLEVWRAGPRALRVRQGAHR
jgi:hypothetical protein